MWSTTQTWDNKALSFAEGTGLQAAAAICFHHYEAKAHTS